MFAFLPQPMHEVRLHELESQRNEQFVQLCNAGFAQMRQGFDLINETDCSGLRSGETVWRQYDDGFSAARKRCHANGRGDHFQQLVRDTFSPAALGGSGVRTR